MNRAHDYISDQVANSHWRSPMHLTGICVWEDHWASGAILNWFSIRAPLHFVEVVPGKSQLIGMNIIW